MRRKRGDLIQFYKILNGIDHIEWKNELTKTIQGNVNGPVASNLRREGVCFQRESARICTVRDKFFLNRVIPLWNALSQETKEATSLSSFKAKLDGKRCSLQCNNQDNLFCISYINLEHIIVIFLTNIMSLKSCYNLYFIQSLMVYPIYSSLYYY